MSVLCVGTTALDKQHRLIKINMQIRFFLTSKKFLLIT